MSFESYVQHISQKYRLAVALAVLKDKPESVSIKSYLEDLRNKINDDMSDSEITVCSADFNLDDDIINDNTLSCNDQESYTQSNLSVNEHIGNNIPCNNEKRLNNDTAINSQESISILNDIAANELIAGNDNTFNNNDVIMNQNGVMMVEDDIINDKRSTLTEDQSSNTRESISILKGAVLEDEFRCFDKTNTNKETVIFTQDIEKGRVNTTPHQLMNEYATQDLDDITYYNTQMNENAQTYSNIEILHNEHNYYDSQAVPINLNVETQNFTHVSQSQYDNVVINERLFKSKGNNNCKEQQNITNSLITTDKHIEINEQYNLSNYNKKPLEQFSGNQMEVDTQEMFYENGLSNQETLDTNILSLQMQPISKINEHNDRTKAVNDVVFEHNDKINEVNDCIDGHTKIYENDDTINKVNDIVEIDTGRINEHNHSINEQNEEIDEGSQELIPFKIIEELNKVKHYLNRTVDRRMSNDGSLDSGYKSDSQSRSSYKNSSQCSGSFLNQSGHCLFDFIMTAPVIRNTREIVNDIAQVLAQLVDKLHEEEKYLLFLDEMLEKIDFLLQDILAGSSEENFLLKKDEDMHRLMLLNISTNIQKYTIEKIIQILNDLQEQLSNKDNLYEIAHTEESENICYIFHILEILLRKYVKKKDYLTPKSSQTDLKKSSLTDIWKKKWNPNYKSNEIGNLTVVNKTCILTKCSEILNKLVVTCMDGYSLISFAALQCFNTLQS